MCLWSWLSALSEAQESKNNVYLLNLMTVFFSFQDRVSLCSPGCPETHSVDQAGLELRNLPASASQVLGLKVCATTAQLNGYFLSHIYQGLL